MKIRYYLKYEQKPLIESIIESLYQNRDKESVKLITWEKITTDWLNLSLPNDEIDRKNWIQWRSMWIKQFNDTFIEAKYPCHLEVQRGEGAWLLINGAVVTKKISKRGRKIKADINTTIKIFDELINCFPKEQKSLNHFKNISSNMMFAISGMIFNSNLPNEVKMAFLSEFNKGLPAIEQ
jgi:hypothetical protein